MKYKKAVIVAIGLGLLFVATLSIFQFHMRKASSLSFLPRSVVTEPHVRINTAPSAVSAPNRPQQTIGAIVSALATPINFYGKVVDQFGDAVPNAEIRLSALDQFDADGSKYSRLADNTGHFEVKGIKGAALLVSVHKKGYYKVEDSSSAAFAYGVSPDATRRMPPTKQEPAVFLLRKMGSTEPMLFVDFGQVEIPMDGRAKWVDLGNFEGTKANFCFQSWVNENAHVDFSWTLRLSAPGGGVMERKDRLAFEAPEAGYLPFVEITMPTRDGEWHWMVEKTYFARLEDGRYARMEISFRAGGRNFVVLRSYVNPKAGSRNLEYDPKNVAEER